MTKHSTQCIAAVENNLDRQLAEANDIIAVSNVECYRLRAVNEKLVEALENAEREMKIAHDHVSPALQSGIYHNLKDSIDQVRTALDMARKP